MVKFDISKVVYVQADSLSELEYQVNEVMADVNSDREYWAIIGPPVQLGGALVQTLSYTRIADSVPYGHSS